MNVKGVILLTMAAVHVYAAGTDTFRPGALWPDNNGTHINAHGGGILFHEGTYYWFGEHKVAGEAGNKAEVGVHVYASKDLCNWTDEGIALSVSDDPDSDIAKGCILERPKVVFNRKTGRFVMWFHLELKGMGYAAARSGVAVADTPTGPYTFVESFRPDGSMARDQTIFVDNDDRAYQLYASESNRTLHVSLLSDDYLKPSGKVVRAFEGRYMEAPAVCRHNGKYWLIASGCSGWAPNVARSAVADSMLGPWTELGNPCVGVNPQNGLGPEKTFGAQSTFILPVQGRPDAFIAMFDIWRPKNAIDGRYVWLPIKFEDDRFSITWRDEWDLSVFDTNLLSENLSDWKLSWKGDELMSVADGVLTYEQAPSEKTQNAFFEQTVSLESDQFYDFSMEYRSEDGLTPVIVVTYRDSTDADKPIRLHRMPPSTEWTTYKTRMCMGSKQGNFRIRICPAAMPNRVFRNKEKVRSDHPGKAQFRNVQLVKSDFSEPAVVRPPKAFETETYVYKTVGDLDLVLKIDRPLEVEGPVPVIFWVHGGGWSVGSPDDMLWNSAMHASQGVAGARVQYRLIKQGGTFKKTFGDLLDAVEWLRQHADERNIDMSRLIMAGGSAGGHLSSILAQKTPECIGYIGFCGMYDLTNVGESRFAYQPKGFMGSLDFDTLAAGSAIHNIRDNPPQTLLMHGDADATIDYDVALRFADALRAKGGKVKVVLMNGGGHDMQYPWRQQKEIHGLLQDLGIYTNDFETMQRKWAETEKQ